VAALPPEWVADLNPESVADLGQNTHQAPGLSGFSPLRYLVISSRVDSVKLTKATVNRGNCKTFNWRGPNPLQFGQEKRAMLSCDLDQVKEVVVETDQGEFTFTF
jgi:hypothetical protein